MSLTTHSVLKIVGALALLSLAAPVAVLAQAPPADENTAGVIAGVATYRERIAMPKDAVFEATLSDVSKMDTAAETIGTATMENPGNPPYHFSITYDPRRIVENHSYAVRATIKIGGRLAFTSDTSYPVITNGNGKNVDILLKHVARATTTSSTPPGSSGSVRLEDTTWKLTRLGDKDVVASDNQRQPYIVLDSSDLRVAGSGGCNRLNGSYTLEKQTIHFGPIASTMMACPSGMDLEGIFLRTLDKAHRWKIQGNELEFQDEEGAFLMRFEAAPPQK
jgi:putative lipoprotein